MAAYAPTYNVSALTARTNDEGWATIATIFAEWLKGSRISAKDGLLLFSVGGGNLEQNVRTSLISAIQVAKQVGAIVTGIVGRGWWSYPPLKSFLTRSKFPVLDAGK